VTQTWGIVTSYCPDAVAACNLVRFSPALRVFYDLECTRHNRAAFKMPGEVPTPIPSGTSRGPGY
jgi:hypothetical protein